MSNLRPIEIDFIDRLTGMSSGYVLHFTNQTFAEFFKDEVGVDIYDDAYAEGSGSNGKRLRAFLRKGQPVAVAKCLTALWEYRETTRLSDGEAEAIPDCRKRLSKIVERLGGSPLASYEAEQIRPAEPEPKGPGGLSVVERQRLSDAFLEIHGLSAQRRGYAFERFLTAFFDAWGFEPRDGFRNTGEQIDGSFLHDNDVYLLEAKWTADPTGASDLHAFQGKVSERAKWARGLFVSYTGYSDQAFAAFSSRDLLLMDGADIVDILQRNLAFDTVIRAKLRHAVEHKAPFVRTTRLFPV